jgi:hypothetical protein
VAGGCVVVVITVDCDCEYRFAWCVHYAKRGNETTVIDDRNVLTGDQARSFRGKDFDTWVQQNINNVITGNTLGTMMDGKIQLVVV